MGGPCPGGQSGKQYTCPAPQTSTVVVAEIASEDCRQLGPWSRLSGWGRLPGDPVLALSLAWGVSPVDGGFAEWRGFVALTLPFHPQPQAKQTD